MNQKIKFAGVVALSALAFGCGGGGDDSLSPIDVKPKIDVSFNDAPLPINEQHLCYLRKEEGSDGVTMHPEATPYFRAFHISVTHPSGNPITDGNLTVWTSDESIIQVQSTDPADIQSEGVCEYFMPNSSVKLNNGRTTVNVHSVMMNPHFTGGEATVYFRFNWDGHIAETHRTIRVGVGGGSTPPRVSEIRFNEPRHTILSDLNGSIPTSPLEVYLVSNGAEAPNPPVGVKNLRFELDPESALNGATLTHIDGNGVFSSGGTIDIASYRGRANLLLRGGWLKPGQDQRQLTLTAISDDDNNISNGIQNPVKRTINFIVANDIRDCSDIYTDQHSLGNGLVYPVRINVGTQEEPVLITGWRMANATDLHLGVLERNTPYTSAEFGKRCLKGPFKLLHGQREQVEDTPPGMSITFDNVRGTFRLVGTPTQNSRRVDCTEEERKSNTCDADGRNPIPYVTTVLIEDADGNIWGYNLRVEVQQKDDMKLAIACPDFKSSSGIEISGLSAEGGQKINRTLHVMHPAAATLKLLATGLPTGISASLNAQGNVVLTGESPKEENSGCSKDEEIAGVHYKVCTATLNIMDTNPNSPTYNTTADSCKLTYRIIAHQKHNEDPINNQLFTDCRIDKANFAEPFDPEKLKDAYKLKDDDSDESKWFYLKFKLPEKYSTSELAFVDASGSSGNKIESGKLVAVTKSNANEKCKDKNLSYTILDPVDPSMKLVKDTIWLTQDLFGESPQNLVLDRPVFRLKITAKDCDIPKPPKPTSDVSDTVLCILTEADRSGSGLNGRLKIDEKFLKWKDGDITLPSVMSTSSSSATMTKNLKEYVETLYNDEIFKYKLKPVFVFPSTAAKDLSVDFVDQISSGLTDKQKEDLKADSSVKGIFTLKDDGTVTVKLPTCGTLDSILRKDTTTEGKENWGRFCEKRGTSVEGLSVDVTFNDKTTTHYFKGITLGKSEPKTVNFGKLVIQRKP